jgi:hypothetical protein
LSAVREEEGVRVDAECCGDRHEVVDVDAAYLLRCLGASVRGAPVFDLVEGVGAEVVATAFQLG